MHLYLVLTVSQDHDGKTSEIYGARERKRAE